MASCVLTPPNSPQALGRAHPLSTDTLYNMALVQRRMGLLPASLQSFETVAAIVAAARGADHADARDALAQARKVRTQLEAVA